MASLASHMLTILLILILIISVILHELAHGYVADMLGDPTARLQGRLTLNPIKHIDPIGSILVPVITSFAGFTFGWAKPIPYNPYNLRNKRLGEFLIALAGPASNLLIAFVFSGIIRFAAVGLDSVTPFIEILSYIVIINLTLAVFNLIPLPPLDGSKILFSILPVQYSKTRQTLESFGPILALVMVFLLWQFISPVIPWLFGIFTGISL